MRRLVTASLLLLATTAIARADVDKPSSIAASVVAEAEAHLKNPADADLKAFLKKVDKCTAALADAPSGSTVNVEKQAMSIQDAGAFCAAAAKRAQTKWITGKLVNYAGWIDNVKKPGHGLVAGEEAVRQAGMCRDAVDAASTAGASPSASITLKSGQALTLAEAKAKICDEMAAAGQGVVDAEKAKEEAKKAPFRKVLTGDKLGVLENLWGDTFYGVGGTILDTPEALQGASVWFGVLSHDEVDDAGITRTHWIVRKYVFSGDKLTGPATDRSGCCDEPSSSDYQ
jgi:hypothetical protein